ncbi:hypothetical protein JK636_05625 [Clostridium sp. YIM B02515]|uniref:Uncharacterized protein n=1 Tax=Clostridium rhizosphaerae TaxID=2803861 RepID=A0ABS1T7B0_9CLOT|nr:hypothetical protein [Clostridium rhizosphaerae]
MVAVNIKIFKYFYRFIFNFITCKKEAFNAALAYSFQILYKTLMEEYDVYIDEVITDK